ncbi:MAG: two-component system cell cycle response regulator [Gammaproteobacteria bacterium]|jgi:two-component system cell cycle response regulator
MLTERQDGYWIQVADHHFPNGSTVTISTDVTESQRLRQELEWLASNDMLTEVLNCRGFMALAQTEFARAKRYDHHMTYLMLDIERFKQLNDEHRHAVGDQALRRVALICRNVLRDQDEIGRLGGEEFGVLLPETAFAQASVVAERLRGTVEEQTTEDKAGYGTVTLSIGGANRAPESETLEALVRAADLAWYDAKRAGRNCVRMDSEERC